MNGALVAMATTIPEAITCARALVPPGEAFGTGADIASGRNFGPDQLMTRASVIDAA